MSTINNNQPNELVESIISLFKEKNHTTHEMSTRQLHLIEGLVEDELKTPDQQIDENEKEFLFACVYHLVLKEKYIGNDGVLVDAKTSYWPGTKDKLINCVQNHLHNLTSDFNAMNFLLKHHVDVKDFTVVFNLGKIVPELIEVFLLDIQKQNGRISGQFVERIIVSDDYYTEGLTELKYREHISQLASKIHKENSKNNQNFFAGNNCDSQSKSSDNVETPVTKLTA